MALIIYQGFVLCSGIGHDPKHPKDVDEQTPNVPIIYEMKVKIYVIVSILGIGSVFFSCAANKGAAETGMNVTAKGTPNGIVVHFDNIPEDTTDLSLAFVDIYAKNQPETVVMINRNALDEVKKTGTFFCPFAESGREYFIRVYRLFGTDVEIYYTGAVAGGGIYLTNTPSLNFSNGNNTLTLSEMPVFSEEVFFSQSEERFRYDSFLRRDDGYFWQIGYESTNDLDSHNSLKIYPEIKEELEKKYAVVFAGGLPLYGTVHCRVIYENMEWSIGLAQSEDVIVSFN